MAKQAEQLTTFYKERTCYLLGGERFIPPKEARQRSLLYALRQEVKNESCKGFALYTRPRIRAGVGSAFFPIYSTINMEVFRYFTLFEADARGCGG